MALTWDLAEGDRLVVGDGLFVVVMERKSGRRARLSIENPSGLGVEIVKSLQEPLHLNGEGQVLHKNLKDKPIVTPKELQQLIVEYLGKVSNPQTPMSVLKALRRQSSGDFMLRSGARVGINDIEEHLRILRQRGTVVKQGGGYFQHASQAG